MKKEKFIIPIIATFIFSVALAADTQPVPPEKWQNPVTWTRIKAGQTPAQVKTILGEPTATESTNSIEAWYYGDEPQTDENGNTERPKHGFLTFRRTPTEHLLAKWVEPNWKALPTWEQLQTAYKDALAEQRAAKIAEQNRLREEAAAARAKQVEERKRILAERAAKNEQRKTSVYTSNREPAKIPAAKPDAHAQFVSRYFIGIGGAFIGIAFIIACTYGFKLFRN